MELSPRYDRRRTLAYAIARAAPAYATLEHVLSEAARGAGPSFRPRQVLEYGARAGAGTWAVAEVGCPFAVQGSRLAVGHTASGAGRQREGWIRDMGRDRGGLSICGAGFAFGREADPT